MRSVNKVTLMGRLPSAPEFRKDGPKPVCNFDVETTESWMDKNSGQQQRVTIHRCTAFGPTANVMRGAREGGYVYVEGTLRADRHALGAYSDEVVCFAVILVADPEASAVELDGKVVGAGRLPAAPIAQSAGGTLRIAGRDEL